MNWLLLLQITDLAVLIFCLGFLALAIITTHPRVNLSDPPIWVWCIWLGGVGTELCYGIFRGFNDIFHWI